MPNATQTDPTTATVDLYREVHKGIRHSLFGLCEAAGALDPADPVQRGALVARFAELDLLLTSHHEHEDEGAFGEIIARLAGAFVDELETAHRSIARSVDALREAVVGLGDGGIAADELYDRIVALVADYLAHMEVEERGVMPTLAAAATFDELLAVQMGIRSTIPPSDMCVFLRSMLPAMNPDERVAMLGGMRANAPAEVFGRFWATATDVLTTAELSAVAARIGA
jgi:hypothetical protein